MRTAGLAFLLILLGGCASFGGRSRPFDAARLSRPGLGLGSPTPLVSKKAGLRAASLAMVEAPAALDLPMAPPSPLGLQGAAGRPEDLARARGLSASPSATATRCTTTATRPVLVGLLIPAGPGEAPPLRWWWRTGDDQFVTRPASGWRVRSWTELDAAWLPAGRPALVVLGLAPRAVAGMARAAPRADQPASP
jgi:hypothetical protein